MVSLKSDNIGNYKYNASAPFCPCGEVVVKLQQRLVSFDYEASVAAANQEIVWHMSIVYILLTYNIL